MLYTEQKDFYYLGDPKIPNEKKEEFACRMLTILREGGVMGMEPVQMFGDHIQLLCSPKVGQVAPFSGDYSYFDGEHRGLVSFDPETATFQSNTVGHLSFKEVIHAAYLLYEFYTATPGIVVYQEDVQPGQKAIGWLNHLFLDGQYTNQRAADMWRLCLLLKEHNGVWDQLLLDVAQELPERCIDQSGMTIYTVVNHYEEFLEYAQRHSDPQNDNLFQVGKMLVSQYNALCKFRDNDDGWSKKEKQLELQRLLLGYYQKEEGPPLDRIVKNASYDILYYFMLTAACFCEEINLRAITEVFEEDFWTQYRCFTERFTPRKLHLNAKLEPCPVVDPVATNRFLECDNDDRAYFWKQGGDVVFSDEMESLLNEIGERIHKMVASSGTLISENKFLETMIHIIQEAQETYYSVNAFQEMFYSFMDRAGERPVQASILVLKELIADYRSDVEAGSKTIRRYLAVLANDELRKARFGF